MVVRISEARRNDLSCYLDMDRGHVSFLSGVTVVRERVFQCRFRLVDRVKCDAYGVIAFVVHSFSCAPNERRLEADAGINSTDCVLELYCMILVRWEELGRSIGRMAREVVSTERITHT